MRIALTAAALALAPMATEAATVALTFDPSTLAGATPACTGVDGGLTDRLCTSGDFIGSDYGSTSTLNVSYDPSGTAWNSLRFSTSVGGAQNRGGHAVQAPGAVATDPSAIIFTPLSGYEVSFQSFNWVKTSATTSAKFHFDVFDPTGGVLFSAGNSQAGYAVNTAYFGGPVTFKFTNGGQGSVGIDSITVDVRGVGGPPPPPPPPPGGVPEPATWAMMLMGFIGTGSMLRARRRLASVS